jgi:predicted lactoylglutathione lyase
MIAHVILHISYRTEYGAGYYGAFVFDPDGNNIEAMYWNESK